jgi:hypothetical protein
MRKLSCYCNVISEGFEGTQLPGNKETTQTKQQDTCFQRIIEQSPCMSASTMLSNVIQAFAKLLVCWPAPAFGQYSVANCSQEVDTPSEPGPPLLSHARATVKCRQYVTYNNIYIYYITCSATCCPEPVQHFDNKHDNHDHHH